MNWKDHLNKLEAQGLLSNGSSKLSLKESIQKMEGEKPYSRNVSNRDKEIEKKDEEGEDGSQSSTFKEAELNDEDRKILLELYEKRLLTQEAYEAVLRNPKKMAEIIEMLRKINNSEDSDNVKSLKKDLHKGQVLSHS